MTMFRTLGSVIASIGSFRYGVRFVLQGPASAALSGESRLYLSAHSETVRFSGGLKPRYIFRKQFSVFLFTEITVFVIQWQKIRRPPFTFPDVCFVLFRIIFVISEFRQNLIALLTDNL